MREALQNEEGHPSVAAPQHTGTEEWDPEQQHDHREQNALEGSKEQINCGRSERAEQTLRARPVGGEEERGGPWQVGALLDRTQYYG